MQSAPDSKRVQSENPVRDRRWLTLSILTAALCIAAGMLLLTRWQSGVWRWRDAIDDVAYWTTILLIFETVISPPIHAYLRRHQCI